MSGYNEILWYGERGIVNALIVDIVSQQKAREFLGSIMWASGEAPTWVSEVAEVTFLVEHGFAQFGNPDLILICRQKDQPQREATQVVFVEAKAIPYMASAADNAAGMCEGFNSTINGQLSLRHRLAWALSCWDGASNDLREPCELHAGYCREASGLCDRMRHPRHLAKSNMLAQIRSSGMHGLPLANYHLVALTTDELPFWQVTADTNLLPLCLDTNGQSIWGGMSSRVGWTGYQRIKDGVQSGAAVSRALESMNLSGPTNSTREHLGESTETSSVPCLRTTNRETLPDAAKKLASIEAVASEIFGSNRVKVGPGSTSITFEGRVAIKLVPLDHGRVLLGLSPELQPKLWCPFDLPDLYRIGAGRNQQPFHCFELSTDVGEALRQSEDVFIGAVEREID